MRKLPEELMPVPEEEWAKDETSVPRVAVWRSRHYLVQVFAEENGMLRISACRTTLKGDRWEDGLTWDELQKIKHDIRLGDYWAVELYPPDHQVVNVANMRHLWCSELAPDYGWRRT